MQSLSVINILRYEPKHKAAWDSFVKKAKNSHFMFYRDYMDYHADRFMDHSLMVYKDNYLLALLPASQHDAQLISHGGLSFAGFLLDENVKAKLMLEIFSNIRSYLSASKVNKLIYKAIPYIFHKHPSAEDLYALYISEASLVRRDISSAIFLRDKLSFSGGKKNGIAKAKKHKVHIVESQDYQSFIDMLNALLTEKHNASATHTANELQLLANRFPDNIKLYAAFHNEEMVAGAVMYITDVVAHTQYMATTENGRTIGALDFLLDRIINDIFVTKEYVNFGISTEQQGRYLNEGLINQKEMFGARAIVYDTYELQIT